MSSPDPHARVFAALGDRTRLSLLVKLSDGQTQSIVRLAGNTRLTRQAVTKHLRVLEEAGLVSSIRIGRESHFTYNAAPIARAKSFLDTVSAQWDDALSRLRAHVER